MTKNGIIYRMDDSETRSEWLGKRNGRGVGASEADAMCNKSRWTTQLELWELKTGLREPQAPTDAMLRGIALEGSVRDRFMEKFGKDFDLEYNPYGMYYRTDYPMLYATLDGVLIAKHDMQKDLGDGNVISMKTGEKAILEIKCPSPRDMATYLEWDNYPHHYRFQASQQMLCSGIDKQIMVANITGDLQQTQPYDERIFVLEASAVEAETKEIIATAPKFWDMVKTKTRPASVMELNIEPTTAQEQPKKEIVLFKAEITAGSIWDNLEEAKKSVIEYAKQYEGITFTDDQYKEAKALRARLNNDIKAINDTKLSIKKQWNEPYTRFEAQCKEMMKAIEDVNTPIDNQIKAFEDSARKRKKVFVTELLDRVVSNEYPDLVGILGKTNGYTVKESWFNASTNYSVATKDLKAELDGIRKDMLFLEETKKDNPEEVYTAILTAYITSGRNLQDAISARYIANRAIEDRRKAEEKAREEDIPCGIPPQSAKPAMAEEKATEPNAEPRVYTLTVEFSHTDPNKIRELAVYLKDNGFHCKTIR